jgi:D-ribose pyranase
MRHTDLLCIGDCGLPCPAGTELIDVSLEQGVPHFIEVLRIVLEDMKVEKVILAEEIKEKNPQLLKEILRLFPDMSIVFIPHEELKKKLTECKAVIRTGEATPYANVILQSACIF